jgi:uncharacterized repeat protein (TIGR01451 family)
MKPTHNFASIQSLLSSLTRSISSSTRSPNARAVSNKPSRFSALSVSIALSMLLAAMALSPSAPSMLTGSGSVTAFDETIGTFAADFTTPKSSWNLGETANAKATGSPEDRRVEWVAPDGSVARVSGFYSGTLSDSYAIQTGSDPLAQVGTWTVQTVDPSGSAFVAAQFEVRDPNNFNADLAIAKYGPTSQISAGNNISYRIEVINHGPDDAQNVTLSDIIPANTTFVSEAQSSGPAFNCSPPSGGTVSCTISTLSVNALAIFSLTVNVTAGTADGTLITNVASISSTTNDPRPSDNTGSTSNTVVAASNVCTLTCPGDVNATAGANQCSATVSYSTPGTSGNCGTDPVECSPPSGSTFPIGTTTVNCNTASGGACSFNVIVSGSDTTAPTITCPSNIATPEDPAGTGAANVTYPTPAATDNCTQTQDIQVSCSPPSGSGFPTGTTTVTCTATDASTNSASCTFTVTVAPNDCALTCPGNVTESTSSGCSRVVTYAAPTQSGSCGSVSCDPASGSVFPVGATQVICAARDTSGNLLASCNFTVTVNDTGTLTCPANITTPENPQGSGSATVNYQEPAACSGPPVTCTPESGSTFLVGATTVTCTNTGSCTFTVTVTTGTCTINCPANKTVSNDPNECGAVVTFGDPTISGSCGGSDPGQPFCNPPSGSFFPVGANTVTCGFSNINFAQCTFTVTVNDTQPPVIGSCPANITKNNDPGLCSAVATYTTPTATDNCSGVGAVSCSPASSSTFAKGTTTVTCSATDAHDNTGSCSFTVTVNDNEKPTISCPANITRANDTGLCSAVVSFSATASDNCPGATANCSPASGSTFPKGTTTVTCSATDTSGNTSATTCSFTVTVNDTENPTISCPANKVQSTDPNACSAVVNFSATANDNCPGVTYSCAPASGTVFPKGTTTVTCTASDTSSHTASCQFTVTVNDTQPPAITCPANIVKEPTCPAGAKATFAPVVSDNCPGVGFVCSPATGSTFPIGTTTVTCTATDTSGNSTSCSFTVTVLTASATIQNLKTSVNSSSLNGSQKQGLISKLDAALDAIAGGHTNTACAKLADFINSVQNFIGHGDISAAQGQPWIDSAAKVRNYLGCTNLPCS